MGDIKDSKTADERSLINIYNTEGVWTREGFLASSFTYATCLSYPLLLASWPDQEPRYHFFSLKVARKTRNIDFL